MRTRLASTVAICRDVVDPAALLRALKLVAPLAVPAVLVAVVLCAVSGAAYRRWPENTYVQTQLSTDHIIVLEQMKRAATLPAPDILFIGDSSCLMGIDAERLRARLPGIAVESLCNIGYVGPAGYAHLLRRMARRGERPGLVVLALHPIQFRRDASWEGWVPFVEHGPDYRHGLLLPDGLDFARVELLGRLIHFPLPGGYGRYFGDFRRFAASVRDHHGGTIDPGAGLRDRSLAQFLSRTPAPDPPGETMSFDTNEAFLQAIDMLSVALDELAPGRVLLMTSPFPARMAGPRTDQQRDAAMRRIAERLKLPPESILRSPAARPDRHFASQTHLHRWGRALFTDELAALLASEVRPRPK